MKAMKALISIILLFICAEMFAQTEPKEFSFQVDNNTIETKTEKLREAIFDDLLVTGFSRASTKGSVTHSKITKGTKVNEEFREKYEHIYEITFALDYKRGEEEEPKFINGSWQIRYSMPMSYFIELVTEIINHDSFSELKEIVIDLRKAIDEHYGELSAKISDLNNQYESIVSLIEAGNAITKENLKASDYNTRQAMQSLDESLKAINKGQDSMYQEILKIPGEIKRHHKVMAERFDDLFVITDEINTTTKIISYITFFTLISLTLYILFKLGMSLYKRHQQLTSSASLFLTPVKQVKTKKVYINGEIIKKCFTFQKKIPVIVGNNKDCNICIDYKYRIAVLVYYDGNEYRCKKYCEIYREFNLQEPRGIQEDITVENNGNQNRWTINIGNEVSIELIFVDRKNTHSYPKLDINGKFNYHKNLFNDYDKYQVSLL